VRRGADVVKAVALGAKAVVIGRIAAFGLAADGQAGVESLLRLMREEITTIMTLAGRARMADLGLDLLQPA
jgi:4-hydroxymandelate oxidase